VQKAFSQGTDAERTNIIQNLRKGGNGVPGVKTVAVGEASCQARRPAQVNSIEEYKYPVEFDPRGGTAVPTAFETRNIGVTTALTIANPGADGSYSVDMDTRDVVLNKTDHYKVSATDQNGSMPQPIFTTGEVKTRIDLMPGVTKLVGSYSPYKDTNAPARLKDDAGDVFVKTDSTSAAPDITVLRLVFVTVQPEK
jgi:hypothetical protein